MNAAPLRLSSAVPIDPAQVKLRNNRRAASMTPLYLYLAQRFFEARAMRALSKYLHFKERAEKFSSRLNGGGK